MRLTRPPCAPCLLSAARSPKTKVHRASSKCFVIIFQEQLDQQTCYLCKTEGSTAKTWTMVNTIKMDAMVKGPNATQTNPARPSQVPSILKFGGIYFKSSYVYSHFLNTSRISKSPLSYISVGTQSTLVSPRDILPQNCHLSFVCGRENRGSPQATESNGSCRAASPLPTVSPKHVDATVFGRDRSSFCCCH